MAHKVELRYTRVSDAKRMLEILGNPNFIHTNRRTCTVEEQKARIRTFPALRKAGEAYIYVILYGGIVVGGCNINVNQRRKHIGEIGFFVDEKYWGIGIASRSLRLLNNIGFKEIGLKRIELLIATGNIASQRVALKCGYDYEATKRKAYLLNEKYLDMNLYAKVK